MVQINNQLIVESTPSFLDSEAREQKNMQRNSSTRPHTELKTNLEDLRFDDPCPILLCMHMHTHTHA